MKPPRLFRPEWTVTVKKPIRGRLLAFLVWLKCIRLIRVNMTIENTLVHRMHCGSRVIDRYYCLCIPKLKVVDGS